MDKTSVSVVRLIIYFLYIFSYEQSLYENKKIILLARNQRFDSLREVNLLGT